ncbi:MAG: alkaline phosphatase family protein [Thermoplasmata archaeon]
MKLAVVGLDSADWTLLDRWSHHLPYITEIRREGVSGSLESCRPPVTIPAWKCYSTGKNPGRLGVYWFAYPDFRSRRLNLNLPGGIGGNLWDYIPNALVINTPGTFPPRTIDGVLIAGFPCHSDTSFATPPWAYQRLTGYRVNPQHDPMDPDFPAEALELIRSRFTTFHRFAPQFDFGQVTIFHIDELHHVYGSDSLVLDAWRMIDEEIGRIMETADNVALVSDHGSGPLSQFVNVAPSLRELGAFRLRRNPWKGFSRLLDPILPVMPGMLRQMGERYSPPKLRDAVRSRLRPMHSWVASAPDQYRIRVDWSSLVLPLNQGLVYRNPRPGRTDTTMSDVKEALGHLPGVVRLWDKEENYDGPLLGAPPDIWMETEPGIELTVRFDAEWETKRPEKGREWIVNHRPEGIFGFLGKDTGSLGVTTASIYDMCPTILSLFGVPTPASLDGNTLPIFPGSETGSVGASDPDS